ncbi:MAG: glycosyltransferase, partial [Chitinophagaceae bacterium]
MKVSGFSYVRNGFTYDYPFVESIRSVLPLCDEFIMVIGDSNDGTREAVVAINDPKIRIVDTIWDENSRKGGFIFSQQANIGLDNCTGDWCFHIQADEVIHEKDYKEIRQCMAKYFQTPEVDGLLIHFLNFFGDFKHYAPSRRYHNKEIRIVRNDKNIRSYKDSQGFRKFNVPSNYLN